MIGRSTHRLYLPELAGGHLPDVGKPTRRSVSLSSRILTDSPAPAPTPDLDEYEKKEKCGLFGIWGPKEASQIAYQGLFAQQHRGQESAGIVVSDGTTLHGHT